MLKPTREGAEEKPKSHRVRIAQFEQTIASLKERSQRAAFCRPPGELARAVSLTPAEGRTVDRLRRSLQGQAGAGVMAAQVAGQADTVHDPRLNYVDEWVGGLLDGFFLEIDAVDPPVPLEGRSAFVKFALYSFSPTPISGRVTGIVEPNPNCYSEGCDDPYPMVAWDIHNLAPFGLATGVVKFVAPRANPNHRLKLSFHQTPVAVAPGQKPLAEASTSVDVAARYTIGPDTLYVDRTRSPVTDTLWTLFVETSPNPDFSDFQGALPKIDPGLAVATLTKIGDVQAGQIIHASQEKGMHESVRVPWLGFETGWDLVPSEEVVAVMPLLYVNRTEPLSGWEAYFLAALLSTFFADPAGGTINTVWDAEGWRSADLPLSDPDSKHATDPPNPVTVFAAYYVVIHYGAQFLLRFAGLCAGIVFLDVPAFTSADLDKLTYFSDEYTQIDVYEGEDSPVGCGGNSRYRVKWRLARVREPGPDEENVQPELVTLRAGQTVQFGRGSYGDWSVDEGAASGTISNTGLYQAPSSIESDRLATVRPRGFGVPRLTRAFVHLDPRPA